MITPSPWVGVQNFHIGHIYSQENGHKLRLEYDFIMQCFHCILDIQRGAIQQLVQNSIGGNVPVLDFGLESQMMMGI